MNKINVIIIDDDLKSIDFLSVLLRNYHSDIIILGTATSAATGLPLIEKHLREIHILFLDIQMPGGDGFSLLEKIPRIDFKVIFTTAHDEFAIRAFRFNALDYLLKPLDHIELKRAIEKFKTEKNTDTGIMNDFREVLEDRKLFDRLAIATLSEIRYVTLENILYFESDNNYSTIYLENNQKIFSSKNIGYYEEILQDSWFFRINNSNLINLKKVERFIKTKSGSVELRGAIMLPVSTRKKERLIDYLGRK